MKLIVISGRSGSGKSTALHQLEDLGFYCVDNLPAALLPTLLQQLDLKQYESFKGVAVCIDARNSRQDLSQISSVLADLPEGITSEIIYLDAAEEVLIKRFSETRRRHPLSSANVSLAEAIASEQSLLDDLASNAGLVIETSRLNLYDLRSLISERLGHTESSGLSLMVESFGFKFGVPSDADLVFDARLLPNPHWVPELRAKTGLDANVCDFLSSYEASADFIGDIVQFTQRWLPHYTASQRNYMTLAIGCTGGQHRSVFVASRVYQALKADHDNVQIRHRELTGKEAH